MTSPRFHIVCHAILATAALTLLLSACARMGQPDGGWYDEEPPRVVGASPADQAAGVNSQKIYINFNEYIKVDNPTENIIISPPQLETPDIKAQGKRIVITLKDSLKPNTTYTVDFSNAITDFTEGNPLGSYTYSFSTGDVIDTMEVSGYVLNAADLEPIEGIQVGLYSNLADSAFQTEPMLRISRTDSYGHFVVKGIAPGTYRIYALQDADGDFVFSQKSERVAFSKDLITPSSKPDVRQDTIWLDSLHISSIDRVPYTHFLPDDIVLRAFNETITDRYLVKSERLQADRFTLYFSYGDPNLPEIKGLNFDEKDAFVVESSQKNDTITYWLRDTTLINRDTLDIQLHYMATDTLGNLVAQTDTLQLLSKQPYARRLKDQQKKMEQWQKQQEKNKKKGLAYDSIMKPSPLVPKIASVSSIAPDENISISFETPLASADTSKIHLYAKHDTLWYQAPYRLEAQPQARNYKLVGEWRPDVEYSLEIDSTAFQDIYGLVNDPVKQGFKVSSNDEFCSIFLTINGMLGYNIVCQLIDTQERVVKEVRTDRGTADFYYVKPVKYYLRMFIDMNNNGIWDTGNYSEGIEPEPVYYYPQEIEGREKWDLNLTWKPTERPLYQQKPSAITKQKGTQEKNIQRRNAERAKKLGIEYVEKKTGVKL